MAKTKAAARTAALVLELEIDGAATLNVGAMWDAVSGAFFERYLQLAKQNLDAAEIDAELQAFIDSLDPEKALTDQARKLSRGAYNAGRMAEHFDSAETLFVVRSEVMDKHTCEGCEKVDGKVTEIGSPEYYVFAPPAFCLGGARCRGLNIGIPGPAGIKTARAKSRKRKAKKK